MILVDTSVWIGHLRRGDRALARLLEEGRVLCHPFVVGELALGNLRQRDFVIEALQGLPQATVATHDEVLHLVRRHGLFGLGIGYIDVHLLAAVRLTLGAALWTRDKRLQDVADKLSRGEWE